MCPPYGSGLTPQSLSIEYCFSKNGKSKDSFFRWIFQSTFQNLPDLSHCLDNGNNLPTFLTTFLTIFKNWQHFYIIAFQWPCEFNISLLLFIDRKLSLIVVSISFHDLETLFRLIQLSTRHPLVEKFVCVLTHYHVKVIFWISRTI